MSSFAKGEILRVLRGHTSWMHHVLFTDGITACSDMTVCVWPIRPAAEAQNASMIPSIDPAKKLYEGEEAALL